MDEWNPAAVVTGAASGIGRAVVELIIARGGRVVAVDRAGEALDALIALATATPARELGRVVTLAGDVTDEAVNARAVARAEERWGRLDAMVLNAGVRASGAIDTVDLEVFDRSIDVNLRAVALGIRVAVPSMRRIGGGSIVVTASNSGLRGEVDRWPYAAAKAGAINLVRSVALDVAAQRIRVNAVCPGPTLTGMTDTMERDHPERYERLRRTVPMQRWARASEIAEVIWFLCSPAASFVTGVALPVDGGVTAHSGQGLLPAAVDP